MSDSDSIVKALEAYRLPELSSASEERLDAGFERIQAEVDDGSLTPGDESLLIRPVRRDRAGEEADSRLGPDPALKPDSAEPSEGDAKPQAEAPPLLWPSEPLEPMEYAVIIHRPRPSPFVTPGPLAGKDAALGESREGDEYGARTRRGGGSPVPEGVRLHPTGLGVVAGRALTTVILATIVAVPLGLQRYFEYQRHKEQASLVRTAHDRGDHARLRELLGTIDPAVREDPEIARILQQVEDGAPSRTRRQAAESSLARLDQTELLEERLAICDQALSLDRSFVAAYVARARVRYALARRAALESGTTSREALTQSALGDLLLAEQQDYSVPEVHLFLAEIYLLREQRGPALAKLAIVQDLEDGEALGHLARGLQAELNQRGELALEEFRLAIAKAPELVPAFLARARVHLGRGEFVQARSAAQYASQLAPTNADALTLLGEARYWSSNQRERQGVLRNLDQALKLDPAHSHALALRAYARLERDLQGMTVSDDSDLQATVRDAERALRLNEKEDLAYLALSEVVRAAGDLREAIRLADRGVELEGTAVAYLWRARLRILDDRGDAALEDVDRVMLLSEGLPGSAWVRARALTMKGGALIELERFSEARDELERALELDSTLATAYFLLGRAHHKDPRMQLSLAIVNYSEAINRRPGLGGAYYGRAAARIDQRQYEDALPDLAEAEALLATGDGARLSFIYFMRARCHYELREFSKAQVALRKFMDAVTPGHPGYTKAREWLEEIEAAEREKAR